MRFLHALEKVVTVSGLEHGEHGETRDTGRMTSTYGMEEDGKEKLTLKLAVMYEDPGTGHPLLEFSKTSYSDSCP